MKKLLFIMLLFVAGNLYASNSTFITPDESSGKQISIKGNQKDGNVLDTRQIIQQIGRAHV